MATLDKPIELLGEQAPPRAVVSATVAPYTPMLIRVGRWALWWADKIGRARRKLFVDGRAPLVAVCAIVAVVLLKHDKDWWAAGTGAAAVLLTLGPPVLYAHRRVMVGDFVEPGHGRDDEGAKPTVDIGNLLQTELSRFGSLFRVVENRRAVSSGLVANTALDATISVDDVVGALQDTVSAETKVALGPISVPVAPFMTLAARAFRAPRLNGSLHRDGDMLILTARQRGHGGLSWRVTHRVSGDAGAASGDTERELEPEERAELSGMIHELALRMFTDLALGRDVRWQASSHFVEGLKKFRAALRTPKDRKVNLREAEHEFLEALSEDEDFPVGYYNLGVVYTELYGLSVAGGRKQEEGVHLGAAETSFKWAIEKDPNRWETHLALAQTQFAHGEYGDVIEHCNQILRLRRKWHLSAHARARDLQARAYLKQGDARRATTLARRATANAWLSLLLAHVRRRAAPNEEGDPVPRCVELAGACATTWALCHSKRLPRGEANAEILRIRAILGMAKALLPSIADVHFEVGLRALGRQNFDLAAEHLGAAKQSDPKRSAFIAADALRVLRVHTDAAPEEQQPTASFVETVESGCREAIEGMAGVFAPARDLDACDLVIVVYEELEALGAPSGKARKLKAVRRRVERRLKTPRDASVSAFFLEALQRVGWEDDDALGKYGSAIRKARDLSARDPRAALRCAESATSLNPLSSLAWETLGDVHSELQDFRSAREAWEYARSRDPDNPRLYDKIGSSHWQIAFDGHSWVDTKELRRAEGYLRRALLLYRSGSVKEQELARYRLAKLYTALADFANALPHLKIVEAVSDDWPLVGWQLLGQAHLREKRFAECEYYFGRVVDKGAELDGKAPDEILGHPIDERHWPIALVRAWGHLGLAFSYVERDGDRGKAEAERQEAGRLAGLITDHDRFPTRIDAACKDCEAFICQRNQQLDDAIVKFEKSVGMFPYSRSYLRLALAYIERARQSTDGAADLAAAGRALKHAGSLRPTDLSRAELDEARSEWDAVVASASPRARRAVAV